MAHTVLHLRVTAVAIVLLVLPPIGARTAALGQSGDDLRQRQLQRRERRDATSQRALTDQTNDSRTREKDEAVIPWPELQAQLRSESWDTRVKAVEYVRSHRIAEAVPELSAMLFNEKLPKVQVDLLQALAGIGNAASSEALCRACIDLPDQEAAREAARLMPTATIEANLDRLMTAAFDETRERRTGGSAAPAGGPQFTDVIRSFQPGWQGGAPGVVVAVGRIQPQKMFSALSNRMNGGDLKSQLICIKILAASDAPDCIKFLGDYCAAENLPAEVRLAAVEGLQGWVEALSEVPPGQRASVTSNLKAGLRAAAASDDGKVRLAALRGMVSVSPPDSLALASELFKSEDPAVRREIVYQISKGVGDRMRNPAQGGTSDQSDYRAMRPFLDFAFDGLADKSPDVRAACGDRIGHFGAMTGTPCIEDTRMASRLAECLSNEQEVKVRECLVGSLGVYGLTAPAQKALVNALESEPEASVRAKAARALGVWTPNRTGLYVVYETTYAWAESEKHLGVSMQESESVTVRDSSGRHYSPTSVRTIVVALTKASKDSNSNVVSEAKDSLRRLGAEK